MRDEPFQTQLCGQVSSVALMVLLTFLFFLSFFSICGLFITLTSRVQGQQQNAKQRTTSSNTRPVAVQTSTYIVTYVFVNVTGKESMTVFAAHTHTHTPLIPIYLSDH